MKKKGRIITALVVVIAVIAYVMISNKQAEKVPAVAETEEQSISQILLSGLNESGVVENTGLAEQTGLVSGENLSGVYAGVEVEQPVTPTFSTISLTFPEQPKMPGNYADNSIVLRKYIQDNKQSITLPDTLSTGTIAFNLKKPLKVGAVTVVTNLFFQHQGAYGRLDMTQAIQSGSSYIFNLNNVAIKLGKIQLGGNFLDKIKGKPLQIGAFVGENGNQVESIVITYN